MLTDMAEVRLEVVRASRPQPHTSNGGDCVVQKSDFRIFHFGVVAALKGGMRAALLRIRLGRTFDDRY